jgi:hypothetical protein
VSNSVVEPSCIWRENAAHPRGKWLPGAKLNVTANRLTAKPGRSSDNPAINAMCDINLLFDTVLISIYMDC